MHRPEIKSEVRRLRSDKGLTFKEIKEKFPYLCKSTISNWVHDISLNSEQEGRILEKQLKRRTEFVAYNQRKHEKALQDTERATLLAKKEIGELSRRELKIVGAALYWAEGYKKSNYVIEFANSDPKMISLIMRFFREILHIKEERFRCKMTLHPGISEDGCLKFWSGLTGVPTEQFNKTWIKPPKSRTGKMYNILYNGTLVVRISDVNKARQLKGYIEALK